MELDHHLTFLMTPLSAIMQQMCPSHSWKRCLKRFQKGSIYGLRMHRVAMQVDPQFFFSIFYWALEADTGLKCGARPGPGPWNSGPARPLARLVPLFTARARPEARHLIHLINYFRACAFTVARSSSYHSLHYALCALAL